MQERSSSDSSDSFYSALEDEAYYFWRDKMGGQGLSPEKIDRMVKDGIWKKLKNDWTDLYIQDIENDLGKEHGWLLESEDTEEENERGNQRFKELEEGVRRRRIEEKMFEAKKAPMDIYDI